MRLTEEESCTEKYLTPCKPYTHQPRKKNGIWQLDDAQSYMAQSEETVFCCLPKLEIPFGLDFLDKGDRGKYQTYVFDTAATRHVLLACVEYKGLPFSSKLRTPNKKRMCLSLFRFVILQVQARVPLNWTPNPKESERLTSASQGSCQLRK